MDDEDGLSRRRDVPRRRPESPPPPQNQNAVIRGWPAALARGVERRCVQPHFELGAEATQAARRPRRAGNACATSESSSRAGSTVDTSAAAMPVSRNPRSPAGCSIEVRTELAREIRAPARAFFVIDSQQAAIRETNVIEPGFEMHGCGEPGARRERRIDERARAATCATGIGRERSLACLRREPRAPVRQRDWVLREPQQPRKVRQLERIRDRLLARDLLRQVEIGKNQREAAHAGIVTDR